MNRDFVLPISLILGTVILLMAIIAYLPFVMAVEIDVYPGNSIQEIINNPNITMGDVIIVNEGIYHENITFLGKAITVRSIDPNNFDVVANTIIDGNQAGSVVTFDTAEAISSVLCGITVRNGENDFGGGIYCNSSSPSIVKCMITCNSGEWGGGIYCYDLPSPTISNCRITENSASGDGGGIYCNSSSPNIINCIITGNSGDWGGGICCDQSASTSISNCIIKGNSATCGGGIECYFSSSTITNCTISENLALGNNDGGGGIYCYFSSPSIINCIISGNSGYYGGGIECYDFSSPIISNCVITENAATWGGGIQCYSSSPKITHCIISRNIASINNGGIDCFEFSSPTISNCILWGDWPEEICVYDINSIPTITHSNIQNGYTNGTAIIDVNPLFVDPNAGDYHLKSDSSCIDTGDPNIPNLPSTDRDGNPRIINNKPDMGAYEYFEELLTLCYGLNFVTFPQGLEWNFLMDQNIPFLKIQTYQSETSTWLTLGPSYDGNFSFSCGKGWLVYITQEEPECIYYSFPEVENIPLLFNPFIDLFPGMNLLNFYSLSQILTNDKDSPVIWPENFFQKCGQETGKESTSVVRYNPLKGKWQADYQFFDRPAGLRSELKKEGYVGYLQ